MQMIDYDGLAKRLAQARGDAGPDEWARQLATTAEYVRAVEAGKKRPSLEYLVKTSAAGGVSLDWLLFDKGPDQGLLDTRNFSDKSIAKLAVGLLAETSLPIYQRQVLGDLVEEAVADPDKLKALVTIYRFLKFADTMEEG